MRSSLPVFYAFLAAAVTSTIATPMPADSLQQMEARGLDDIVKKFAGPLSGILGRSILEELDRRGESVDELLTRMDDSELLVTRKDTPVPADPQADPDSAKDQQTPDQDLTPGPSGPKKHHGSHNIKNWLPIGRGRGVLRV